MTKEGCSYEGGVCKTVVEQCDGCGRITEFSSDKYCSSLPDPSLRWKNGNCNMATHVKTEVGKKQKINPLKASKRGGA